MKRFLLLLALATSAFADAKSFDATYVATLDEIPANTKKIDVWIPLPKSSEHQTIREVVIDSPYAFTRRTDKAWGNDYAYASVENPPRTITTRVKFAMTRNEARLTDIKGAGTPPDPKTLKADRLVTLSPRVRELSANLTADRKTTIDKARAIYDHLLATMTYDKTTPGWGQGDTERACDVRKGNCTDFHSLFMSLARAQNIPSRFVIGYPMTAADGVVKGYHCWAEFWVDGKGWVPVDASDAAKSSDAKLRDYLFGNLDANRVQFTIGRDLMLDPATADPLNYFIYPRAEVGGTAIGVPSIALEFKPR